MGEEMKWKKMMVQDKRGGKRGQTRRWRQEKTKTEMIKVSLTDGEEGKYLNMYVHIHILYMCCPQAFCTNNWEVRLAAMVTTNPITLANKHSHVHLTPSPVGSVMLKVCQCLEMHASYKTLQKRWDAFKKCMLILNFKMFSSKHVEGFIAFKKFVMFLFFSFFLL